MAKLDLGNSDAKSADSAIAYLNGQEPHSEIKPVEEEPSFLVEKDSVNLAEEKPNVVVEPLVEKGELIHGLSMEEMNDANKIGITIADKDAPIVVFFGPTKSGKTMALIRLTRYLKQRGYTVQPVHNFRPSLDKHYAQLCDGFNSLVDSAEAARGTEFISFMLLKVMKNGRTLCQILEAPGEYYYDPKSPEREFPTYVNHIVSSKNRKIWILTVEADWLNQPERDGYVNRIRFLKTNMRTSDKAILLFNKIDKTQYVHAPGKVHQGNAYKHIRDLYPGICEPFKNENPITRWWQDYRLDFMCFQSGNFTTANDGTRMYQQGDDAYPRKLWALIEKRIRG